MLKDKSPTKNNHISPHLLCSKETTKFQTLALVQSSLLQAGMIQISSPCITSLKSLDSTELINIPELILTPLICNITPSTTLSVHTQTSSYTSHSIFLTQILDWSVTSFSVMKSSTEKCSWWPKICSQFMLNSLIQSKFSEPEMPIGTTFWKEMILQVFQQEMPVKLLILIESFQEQKLPQEFPTWMMLILIE